MPSKDPHISLKSKNPEIISPVLLKVHPNEWCLPPSPLPPGIIASAIMYDLPCQWHRPNSNDHLPYIKCNIDGCTSPSATATNTIPTFIISCQIQWQHFTALTPTQITNSLISNAPQHWRMPPPRHLYHPCLYHLCITGSEPISRSHPLKPKWSTALHPITHNHNIPRCHERCRDMIARVWCPPY